jgi:hypothetical protein
MKPIKGYRTPTIDEFIEGFKFELYSFYDDETDEIGGWYEYIFGNETWLDLQRITYELKIGNIRTKK